jgi:AraC family transcriptional regulator
LTEPRDLNEGADLEKGSAGSGRIYLWDGGSLMIGRADAPTDVHAHHAIQIAVSPGTVAFRSERSDWTDFRGVIIEPNYPHAFDGRGEQIAHVFVEPESRSGRAISERVSLTGIFPIPATDVDTAVGTMFEPPSVRRSTPAIIESARRVVAQLAGDVAPTRLPDDRVARVVAYMKANINRSLTLEELADVANLSPGRFRHLFVDETGMTVRPYLLWLRFQRAWELIAAGNSLSSAAHGAGFSDAAHLTRTSRRMFGLPPVAIRME